jgi:hypothetical protein
MLDEEAVLPGPLHRMLDGRAGPFVGPARQRAAEVAGEDRVGDLVGEHRVEDPLLAPLDRHRPAKHLAGVEDEARGATGAELRGNLGLDRTGTAPPRQRLAEPLHREIVPVLLGRLADLPGLSVGRGLDDEVRGSMAGGGCRCGGQSQDGCKQHQRRTHEASFQHVGSTSVGRHVPFLRARDRESPVGFIAGGGQ